MQIKVNGQTDANEPTEPIFFWEFVISDSYCETVENIFYLSFLVKLKVIRFVVSSYCIIHHIIRSIIINMDHINTGA